jgi:DNA-binding MarR family transcriptional regulator
LSNWVNSARSCGKKPDSVDRRRISLGITGKGRTLLRELAPYQREIGPGTKVATGVEAIDFTGAGQDLKFDQRGELLGRPFLHQVIRDGKDVVLGTVGGAA